MKQNRKILILDETRPNDVVCLRMYKSSLQSNLLFCSDEMEEHK